MLAGTKIRTRSSLELRPWVFLEGIAAPALAACVQQWLTQQTPVDMTVVGIDR